MGAQIEVSPATMRVTEPPIRSAIKTMASDDAG